MFAICRECGFEVRVVRASETEEAAPGRYCESCGREGSFDYVKDVD